MNQANTVLREKCRSELERRGFNPAYQTRLDAELELAERTQCVNTFLVR